MNIFRIMLVITVVLYASGCAHTEPYDYSEYKKYPPKSILVIPPLNESTEADAPYKYLSTITRPLAEAGYYVYPVAVVTEFLKNNGLPTPGEMNTVPLSKIKEILNPDAVLYINIEQWGQKYYVLDSGAVVTARLKLVDVDTGTTLWEQTGTVSHKNTTSSGGLVGMLVSAVVNQVIGSITDNSHKAAHSLNHKLVFANQTGLPYGHRNRKAATDPRAQ